jgi:hypothetical protein
MDTVEKIVEDFASDIAMGPFSSGTRLRWGFPLSPLSNSDPYGCLHGAQWRDLANF